MNTKRFTLMLFVMLMGVMGMKAEIVHHTVCQPTLSQRGFTRECWENTETGRIYSDAGCTQELVNEALAKAVIYAKAPKSPIRSLDGFEMSEHENDWDVDLNWAAVTKFFWASIDATTILRSAEFNVSGVDIAHARLVWNRNEKAIVNGKYTVSIFVNNELKFTRNQNSGDEYEGVFVLPLPGLKQGDVVKFQVRKDELATSKDARPAFKASLEYTRKANIAHHTPCEPTLSTVGYARECWGFDDMLFSDEACTHLITDEDLVKTVVYARLPRNPIVNQGGQFEQSDRETYRDVTFNWAAKATIGFSMTGMENGFAEFKVLNDAPSNARFVWSMSNNGKETTSEHTISIYVNGEEKYSRTLRSRYGCEGVFALPLPDLKKNDIVKINVQGTPGLNPRHFEVYFNSCLEYTFDCHHTFPEGSATCSKCGYTINRKHHEAYQPTTYQQGFTQECWENLDYGKYYADASCTQELTGADLAKVMTYAKLPNSPVSILDNFHVVESDNQQTWGIQLNWAAETTFEHTSTTLHSQNRHVEFKAQEDFAGNARLVWMKDQEDSRQGRFSVDINYNGRNISYSQQHGESLGGVFVLPMPALKKGDIVTFTVVQDAKAEETWVDAGPTFKVCLEYTIDKTIISATKDPDKEDVYYTTFYDGHTAYTLGEGTTAYTGTVSGDNLLLKHIQDNVIAKGEAVVIRSNSNTVALTPTNNEKAKDSANQLRGNDTNISTPANCFIMSYGQDKLGFYKYAVGKPLAAHKAYLVYEKPTGAPALRMVFEDAATGIEDPLQSPLKGDDAIYNLNGIRLNKLQKGINIVNGKKVVIK